MNQIYHLRPYLKQFFLIIILLTNSLFTAPAQAVASTKTSDKQLFNLQFNNESIVKVFKSIESQSKLRFVYFEDDLKKIAPVTIKVKDASVEHIMKVVLAGSPIGYSIKGNNVVLERILPKKVLKTGKITGKITDDKGETLPGASFKIIELSKGVISQIDGSYAIDIEPGTYTVEVSFISYQTKRISGVQVSEGKSTILNVVLKASTQSLSEVVVKADYRQESISSLYARQKNSASISNGISAEQIARTPDKNVAESLKRITGVTTIDNKYVVVRGTAERYNTATLDGVVMPSTELSRRNFSFDLIPANLIDNIEVSKSSTPDMVSGFGGGLVQVHTKDIPTENFLNFSAGISYNDISTGKETFGTKRGKYDFWGFDDGRRSFPTNLRPSYDGNIPDKTFALEQSKRFTNNNFPLYKSKAAPSQNYQLSLGQVYELGKDQQFGLIASLSYRNTQSNVQQDFANLQNTFREGYGTNYGYNVNWGALVNLSYRGKGLKLTSKNIYTRVFDNTLQRYYGFGDDTYAARDQFRNLGIYGLYNDVSVPEFTGLLLNKLTAEHALGKVKLNWEVSRTGLNRDLKDKTHAGMFGDIGLSQYSGQPMTSLNIPIEPRSPFPFSRLSQSQRQTDYNWAVSASMPFKLGDVSTTAKVGYAGYRKKMNFNWQEAYIGYLVGTYDPTLKYKSLEELFNPNNFREDGIFYSISSSQLDYYEGKSNLHAGYFMFDHKLHDKWRLVWGGRLESFELNALHNGINLVETHGIDEGEMTEKKLRFMPSANLTYSLSPTLNLRASYGRTAIRPEFLEAAKFARFDINLNGMVMGGNTVSTMIDNFDLRAEWYPGAGEIISIGGFYKYFDQPMELETVYEAELYPYYQYVNQKSAKSYGLEAEIRKSLSFVADKDWLSKLFVYGNATLLSSKVNSLRTERLFINGNYSGTVRIPVERKRPLSGQSPLLINTGIQYAGERWGVNAMYNYRDYQFVIIGSRESRDQYERSRGIIDLQVYGKFLKKKAEVRFNISNLGDSKARIYTNEYGYETPVIAEHPVPGGGVIRENVYTLKPGNTLNYDEGDGYLTTKRYGRTYTLTLLYNF